MVLPAIWNKLANFSRQQRKGGNQIEIGVGISTSQIVARDARTQPRTTYRCGENIISLITQLETHTKVVIKPI